MTIPTNTTDRKAMAHAIAEHLGTQAVYLGPPTFGYQAGVVSINRDASITATDAEIRELLPFLCEHGWVEAVETEETETEEMETTQEESAFAENDESEQTDSTPATESESIEKDSTTTEEAVENTDAELERQKVLVQTDEPDVEQDEPTTDPDDSNPQPTPFPPDTCVILPLASITPSQVINILRMIYARQELIRAMTQSEIVFMDEEIIQRIQDEKPQTHEAIRELLKQSYDIQMLHGVYMDEERFMAAFPIEGLPLEKQAAYMMLMTKSIDFGARAKRVNATRIVPQPEEMKYFCHTWLIQIGFKGTEHKSERAVLLNHLQGYAAFRTTEQMQKHKDKYAELRRDYKSLDEQSNAEENQEHNEANTEEDETHDEN